MLQKTNTAAAIDGMDRRIEPVLAIALLTLLTSAGSLAQSSHSTVHHERVEDPSGRTLATAEAAIDNKEYASAEPLLRQVVALHPEDYAAWYDLGFVCHQLGRREDAIAAYRRSVEANPTVFESNLNLGLLLAESGRPEAERFLRAATNLKPSSQSTAGYKRVWLALGRLLEKTQPGEAERAFRQAAAADPKDPEPHLLAGTLLEQQQRAAEAENEFRQALALDPSSRDATTALANLYMRQHRFSDAEPLLRKLLVVDPGNAGAHFQLGRMLAISGKNDEAAAELETGLKLDPSDSEAERDLADLYRDAGRYDQAQRLYRKLLAAYPNDAALHHGFGVCLLKQKRFAEAETELRRAVQLQPDMGAAYGDLALAANENRDYQLVIHAADLRDKYLPETPLSYFLRATAYDHLHDPKQAAKYYHQFLQTAGGKYPEQEWQAQHRLLAIEPRK
ncbi:MAG: tetratricopeptide repeat protein [Acidobacteria bacterium]|nr:tetratricopeptide repeat protein [Acidobacteriota bacterium]